MIYEYLMYSIFFGLASFLYYVIHKEWRKGRDENPDRADLQSVPTP